MYSKQQAKFVARNIIKDYYTISGKSRFNLSDYIKLLKQCLEKETDIFKRSKIATTIDSLSLYL